jgi:outer membrane protein TolC
VKKILIIQYLFFFLFLEPFLSIAETNPDTSLEKGTLENCVRYALFHNPKVQQSLLDEEITDQDINTKLSDWFPQLNFNFNLIHNYKLPVSIVGGNPIQAGMINSSSGQFSVTQTIFGRDLLLASTTAGDVREETKQNTVMHKVDIVINVSKAFYSVLLARLQIDLVKKDIVRLRRSQSDAFEQYKAGITDKNDYKRGTILLNNAVAELKTEEENLKVRYSLLKSFMGYNSNNEFQLEYDSTMMEKDAFIDTSQSLSFDRRIEYKLVETQRRLSEASLNYYKWSFIPNVSAFGNYNFNFMNDKFAGLYNQNYPNSLVGVQLSFPIFEGGKRYYEIEEAELSLHRTDYDRIALENLIRTEYTEALAGYKSNLSNLMMLKENIQLAREVYNTIQLQYKSGVKSFLEVIIAETDLRETQTNYLNSLYEVLSSKLDVQKALGIVQY